MRLGGALSALAFAYFGVVSLHDGQHIVMALVLFGLATGLLMFTTRGLPPPSFGAPNGSEDGGSILSMATRMSWERAYWLVVLAIAVSVAFLFRLYELDSKPYGIWFDEAQNGIVARGILHGDRPVFVSGLTQLPALFFYVFAASLKLFGNNILSLRLVTTAAGIIAVFFTYLLGKELLGQRVGIFAAFFLAVMRWHVNFSRLAMHGIFAPLFEVVALYFLVRGLKDKGPWNFVAAGIAVGIGLQGYYSFIILPAVIVLFVVHHAVLETSMPLKRLSQGFAILVVSSVLVYAPTAIWAASHWTQFSQRSQTVTITNGRSTSQVLKVALDSTRKHLLMFNAAGDRNGRHNIPGAPMLDQITGSLFVLGFGFAAFNLRRSPYFLLVAWSVLALQGGIWSLEFEAPQAYRTVGITPAIALLAAVPLDRLWALAASFVRSGELPTSTRVLNWTTGGVAIISAVLLLLCARINFHNYFDVQLNRPDTFAQYDADVTFAAKEIKRVGGNPNVSLAAVLSGQPTIKFVDSDADLQRVTPFDWTLSIPSTSTTSTLYLLDAAKKPFWDWLQQVYPKGIFQKLDAPGSNGPDFAYEAVISESDVRQLSGLDATYQAPGAPAIRTRVPNINLDWSATAPPAPMPLSASWHGTLRVPLYGPYKLSFDSPGPARITLDGQLVAEGVDHLEWAGQLYKGDHEILLEAEVQSAGPVRLALNGAPVPTQMLLSYPGQGHGLLASYFANDNWQGAPKLIESEPFIGIMVHSELDDVGRPFTALWSGFLDVPADGDYVFELEAADKGSLKIDAVDLTPELGKPYHLTQGRHPIEVRLLNRGGGARAFLYWKTPSNDVRTVVPPQQLYPR